MAAHQVAMQILVFLALLIDALAIAAQTLIARFLGEDRPRAAWNVSLRLLQWGAVVGVSLALLLVATRGVVPAWFSSEAEVQDALAGIWLILALLQPLGALVYVWDGIVLGAAEFGYLAWAMVLSMTLAVGSLLLVVPFGWGLPGVWWSLIVLTVARSATLGWWHFRPAGSLRPG